MNFIKKANIFLCLCLVISSVQAKDLKVQVKVIDIDVIQSSEKQGDEVYFSVMQYSNLAKPHETRIPLYPAHWLSKQLSNVKNVVLWEGQVKEGEDIRVLLSLLEQDLSVWATHDLGSAELRLLNRNGSLEKHWGVPTFEKPKEVEMLTGEPQRYVFKGLGSRYDVAFQIEQKPIE